MAMTNCERAGKALELPRRLCYIICLRCESK